MAFELDLSALPRRFHELHYQEFASWPMGTKVERAFVLRWPLGTTGPERLRLAWRKERRESHPGTVFGVVYPADHDGYTTLNAYMAAIAKADREYLDRVG